MRSIFPSGEAAGEFLRIFSYCLNWPLELVGCLRQNCSLLTCSLKHTFSGSPPGKQDRRIDRHDGYRR